MFDFRGQSVKVLVDWVQLPGVHGMQWDGRGACGSELSSGVYLYRLERVRTWQFGRSFWLSRLFAQIRGNAMQSPRRLPLSGALLCRICSVFAWLIPGKRGGCPPVPRRLARPAACTLRRMGTDLGAAVMHPTEALPGA